MYDKGTYEKMVLLMKTNQFDLVFELSKSINITILKKLKDLKMFHFLNYPRGTNFIDQWGNKRIDANKLNKIYNNRINKIKYLKYKNGRKNKK